MELSEIQRLKTMFPEVSRVFNLKAGRSPSLMLTLFLFLLLFAASVGANIVTVKAETSALNPLDIRVDHEIHIQNGGSIIINDTISLSTERGVNLAPLQSFPMGFPYEYKAYIDYCFAYDASNREQLNLELDVGLGRIGFYGISVVFPFQVNVSDGESYNFTMTFVLSGLIVPSTETTFNLTRFPMYPSLTQNASECNVKVFLPPGATYLESSHAFNATAVDDRRVLNYTVTGSLESFVREDGWLTFDSAGGLFLLIDNDEVKREITLDEMGRAHVADYYHITNRAAASLSSVKIGLPKGAYGVSAYDSIGNLQVASEENGTSAYTNATVTFRTAVTKDQRVEFTLDYWLPWESYVNQRSWLNFNLTFAFLERFEWIVRKLTVSITLPSGAEFESYLTSSDFEEGNVRLNVQKNVFRETVTFTLYNVTSLHDLSFSVIYRHLIFWASFYPTLWVGAVVLAIFGVAILWRAPKPPAPVIPVPTEVLKGFVDAYEEREKILLELENMEEQVRKGRIPRRRYKLRKITLEGRLSTLSRNLTEFREKILKAGPGYANIVRGIEIAETELEGLEEDIRRITARRRSGELSSEAYHRLLEDYHRRSERAKTTIKGYLLRLREEIR
jgi:hypothetical protein